MAPAIDIYDTTLRDGSQGEGVSFSTADKLRIAQRLDDFGVHFIEGGWPGSNPKDIEFFEEAKRRTFKTARLAAFGSTRRKDIRVDEDPQVQLLLDADAPVVTIFGKTWLLHVREVLQTNPRENLAMIEDTVRFLKAAGRFVVYDAEHAFDGFKEDSEYAIATWHAAERGGADAVVLCDTNGGCITSDIVQITRRARSRIEVQLGIHTHDDIGLGVANALASLEEGVTHIQGTFNGYGERVGNCNLTTLIPNLAFKLNRESVPSESLPLLRDFSQFLDEVANLRPNPRLPWVGTAAFSHKGGTHVNAVQKLLRSYEHVDPAVVGNTRHVLISELAGRASILMKAKELGLDVTKDTPQLTDMLERIKALEHQGYEFEAADGSLTLLILAALDRRPRPFEVDGYHVSMRSDRESSICEATVKVRAGDRRAHTVAEGDGPVNALDRALRGALVTVYPHLESVRLTDYKVRIVNPSGGTGARTRVLIETADEHASWTTVGVHDNIIEASLRALIDSFEYGLIKRESAVAAH